MEIASSGCRRKRQKGEARETERSFQLEALGLLLRFTPKFSPRFPFSRRNLSTGERFKHGTQPRPKHTQQPYVASSSREKIASIYGTLCYITVHSIFMLRSMPVMFAEIFSRSVTTRKSAFKVFFKKQKHLAFEESKNLFGNGNRKKCVCWRSRTSPPPPQSPLVAPYSDARINVAE